MSLGATLNAGRRAAESRMRGTCRITTGLGSVVTDADGNVTTEAETVYEGPFYMRYPGLAHEQTPEVTGGTAVVSRVVVRIPFPQSPLGEWTADPPVVRPGHVVEVLTEPDNPQLVGVKVRVASVDDQSQATAQRLLCEDFQGGVRP